MKDELILVRIEIAEKTLVLNEAKLRDHGGQWVVL
jgi:hypothetical protein